MQLLKERILKEGQAIGKDILKVDSFLNHQIDVTLLSEIGKEFKFRFRDIHINKILTIEASGIAIACAAAWHMGGLKVVFAKKSQPNTMIDGFYTAKVTSFTKGTVSQIAVSKKYLNEDDQVLILDDFLAYGEATQGLVKLVQQSGARLSGIGAVIEKEFQNGGRILREKGYRVESLAIIKQIQNGIIEFSE